MKTLEFKLNLNLEQSAKIDQWLEALKVVWNRGLALLYWRQHYLRWQECLEVPAEQVGDWGFDPKPVVIRKTKVGDDWASYCDCAAEFRVDRSKGREIEGNLELRPVVNLVKAHWQTPPLIDGPSAIALRKPFAKKRWECPIDIPALYVNDFIGVVLAPAWERYQKGIAAKPRFKSRRDRVDTIASESFRAQCRLEGRRVKLPGLEWLSVKTLDTRLTQPLQQLAAQMRQNPDPQIYPQLVKLLEKGKSLEEAITHATTPGAFRICRKASGYYLQITAPLPERQRHTRSRQEVVGIAAGATNLYTTSSGHAAAPAKALEKVEESIIRAQRSLSAQKGRKYPPQIGSNNYKKKQQRIAKLHEKAKRSRRAHAHWHSSNLVDVNEQIILQDLDVQSLLERPDPIPSEEGDRYLPNGAKLQKKVNKAFAAAAGGQFRELVKSKANHRNRQCYEVTPQQIKELLGEVPASRKTLARAIVSLYPGATGETLTPVESSFEETMNQESEAARPGTASADSLACMPDNHPNQASEDARLHSGIPAEPKPTIKRPRRSKKRRKVLAEVEKACLPELEGSNSLVSG